MEYRQSVTNDGLFSKGAELGVFLCKTQTICA